MPRFRIFTNDRGTEDGVPMYSALCEVIARDATSAENIRNWPMNDGGSPAKAIEWPATSPVSKAWLAKHVGD